MEEGLALFATRSTTPMPDQWALVEAEAGAPLEVEDGVDMGITRDGRREWRLRCCSRSRPRMEASATLKSRVPLEFEVMVQLEVEVGSMRTQGTANRFRDGNGGE